jgi:hypothetical protein
MDPLEHPAVKTHAAIKARKCIQVRRLSAPIGSRHPHWAAAMRREVKLPTSPIVLHTLWDWA